MPLVDIQVIKGVFDENEKRQMIEYQLKEQLYNWRTDVRPRVVGKFDEKGEWMRPHGDWLLPATSELTPAMIARVIALAPSGHQKNAGLVTKLSNLLTGTSTGAGPAYYVDSAGGGLYLAYSYAGTPETKAGNSPDFIEPDMGIGGRALTEGRVVRTGDYLADPSFNHTPAADAWIRRGVDQGVRAAAGARAIDVVAGYGRSTGLPVQRYRVRLRGRSRTVQRNHGRRIGCGTNEGHTAGGRAAKQRHVTDGDGLAGSRG